MQILRTSDTLTAPTNQVTVFFFYKKFASVYSYLALSTILVVGCTQIENILSFLNVKFTASVVCAKSVSSF